MSSEEQFGEKILGLGIGKRGKPRLRRGKPNLPHDGDGDGFYSPGPGMPDKTPMPKIPVVSLDGDLLNNLPATGSARESRIASAAAKKIEEGILDRHGNVRDRATAKAALTKMFPNATHDSLIRGRGGDLSDAEYNYTVGLLHLAHSKPRAAKRIKEINGFNGRPSEGGHMTPMIDRQGRFQGISINYNMNCTAESLRNDQIHGTMPYAFETTIKMRDSGHSLADQNRVLQQGIAMHEMAHAIHFEYGLNWHGVKDGDQLPVESIENGFKVGTKGLTNMTDRELDALWTASLEKSRLKNRNLHPDSLEVHQEAAERAAFAVTRLFGLSNEQTQMYVSTILVAKLSHVAWDGVETSKRDAIRNELRKVSGYAGANHEVTPGTQYFEGVAEAISVREHTAGLDDRAEFGSAVGRHLRDVMTKADMGIDMDQYDGELKKLFDDPDSYKLCRGYGSEPVELVKPFGKPQKDTKSPEGSNS